MQQPESKNQDVPVVVAIAVPGEDVTCLRRAAMSARVTGAVEMSDSEGSVMAAVMVLEEDLVEDRLDGFL